MKATPITQRAKSTPFKMNQGLVDGAATLGKSKKTGFEKGFVKTSDQNNQQPALPTPPGEDGNTTDTDPDKIKKTDKEIKKEKEVNSKAISDINNAIKLVGLF